MAVAADLPRTFPAGGFNSKGQDHYVVRGALFNGPDLVMVRVRPETPDSSDMIFYARSIHGESDLGLNRRRAEAWLAAPQTKLPSSSEK